MIKIRGTKVTSPYPVHLTPAETRLVFSLQRIFAPENILVDSYFPTSTNSTNYIQIDVLAINEKGIFVFESKGHGGWIFGNGKQRYWMQILNFGRVKHQFYNPIKQNSAHLRAIADLFPPEVSVYSVVVFSSDATLRKISDVPDNCFVCTHPEVRPLITRLKPPRLLQPADVIKYRDDLLKARIHPDTITRTEHISEIEDLSTANPKTI